MKMHPARWRSWAARAWVAATVTVAGCMANPPVNVEPAGPVPAPRAVIAAPADGPGIHTVVRGENLYRIALEHGLDFRTIAALNDIAEPYTIRPGQRLVLRAGSASTASPARPPAQPSAARMATGPAPVQSVGIPAPAAPAALPAPVPSTPGGAAASRAPAMAPARAPIPAPTPLPAPATAPMPPITPAPVGASPPGPRLADAPRTPGRWQAPVAGRAVRAYSDAHGGNKGVDVEAARGAPVWAASDGTVVYAGDGLKQYGNLIIVKHDEEYLSAYGHLDRALVPEGARVRKGQVIASVGGPGDRGLLHFEIRRRGEPVNPEVLVGRLAR